MPISLAFYQNKFIKRSNTLTAAYRRLLFHRATLRKVDRFALQEGLISALWQAWCGACKTIVISSAQGAITASGHAVSFQFSTLSVDELRYIAKKFSRREKVKSVIPLPGDHLEVTWGDLGNINLIISGFAPTNSAQLLSSFGSMSLVEDLRVTRNACAHIARDRISELRRMQIRYSNNSFIHPSDVIFWMEPQLNISAWEAWIDEMRISLDNAVR